MPELMMSVATGQSQPRGKATCTTLFSAYWMSKGAATHAGVAVEQGSGCVLQKGDEIRFASGQPCDWVRFDLTDGALPADAQQSARVSLPDAANNCSVLLRLDQVTFPPGGVAYRHIHPGAGIRFLVDGKLKILSDTHQEVAEQGHAWFEPAQSPVRAEADVNADTTSFIRFMVLPAVYLGKPTIQILDKEEQTLPRVQVTDRHVDMLAYFCPG